MVDSGLWQVFGVCVFSILTVWSFRSWSRARSGAGLTRSLFYFFIVSLFSTRLVVEDSLLELAFMIAALIAAGLTLVLRTTGPSLGDRVDAKAER